MHNSNYEEISTIIVPLTTKIGATSLHNKGGTRKDSMYEWNAAWNSLKVLVAKKKAWKPGNYNETLHRGVQEYPGRQHCNPMHWLFEQASLIFLQANLIIEYFSCSLATCIDLNISGTYILPYNRKFLCFFYPSINPPHIFKLDQLQHKRWTEIELNFILFSLVYFCDVCGILWSSQRVSKFQILYW